MTQKTRTQPWRFSQILSPAPLGLAIINRPLSPLQTVLYSPSIYPNEESPIIPPEASPVIPRASFAFSDASATTAVISPVEGAYPSPYHQRTFLYSPTVSEASIDETSSSQPAVLEPNNPVMDSNLSYLMLQPSQYPVSDADFRYGAPIATLHERSDEHLLGGLSEQSQLPHIREHDFPYYPLSVQDVPVQLPAQEMLVQEMPVQEKKKSPLKKILRRTLNKLRLRKSK
ncbi:hypothetical protein IQ07DRAFT_653568 [Pyrenochaeta sp. DS3sAY3a]|nr:hypothetical protein IQ07DRAFT_653568 [Pyrenochaeta sp. DS3sAY3a]